MLTVMSRPARSQSASCDDALGQHPAAQRDAQAGVLDQRQELPRRHQAVLRVVPAQQRLGTEHAARAHVDLGLVVQAELGGVQRLLHATERDEAVLGAPVLLGIEEQVAVAAGLLGAVHRLVGVAQQGLAVGAVVGEHRGADARRDGQRARRQADLARSRDLLQHALDRVVALTQRGGAQQQRELVAADARGHVVAAGPGAQRGLDALGQADQQQVADRSDRGVR